MLRKIFISSIVSPHLLKLLIILIFINNLILSQELNWTHTGGPMGGVIGDIAIDSSSEIFAGMYPLLQNGLYKSSDNGNSWEKIRSQFSDFAVYSIYIDKQDHIWVGTDQQDRIYLSTDNGQTWEIKNNGYYTSECWAIGESKNGILFAGNADGGPLFRSTNNGDNWVFSYDIGPLAFATDSINTVYCGTFNGLYYTIDDGISWLINSSLGNFAVSSIIIDTSNNIYCGTGYYNNGYGVFYSDDGGLNWTQLGLGDKVVLSLAFDSEGNLYAGTLNDGLFVTSDLGQNWRQYQNGLYRKDVYRLKINQQDDIFIGSEGNGVTGYGDGGVFRSINKGDSFVQIGLPVSLVKNIVFSGDSLIITATPSGVQSYNRFTEKWNNLGLYKVEAVTITPSNVLYAATQDDGLFKSTDIGNTWTLTNLTADTLMPVYNVLALNDDTVFASTFYNLRRSTDGGNNWDVLSINTGASARALYFNNNILWMIGIQSYQLFLYKTTDLGNSFTTLYSGFDCFDSNNPLSVIDNGYVFLASRNEDLNGIIRSTNEGSIWEQILFMDNNNPTVFANNTGKIITSSVVLSINDTNKIYISTNFGDDWEIVAQPTDFGISITDIKQDDSGKYFFGTDGEGLYEVDIVTETENELKNKCELSLSQNYPNPFNPTTVIRYSISKPELVQLKVYNILGQEVQTLVNEFKQAGIYEIEFDGSGLSTGVYFYRMTTGNYVETRKLVLLK